jgi:alpha,alpha-trehalase
LPAHDLVLAYIDTFWDRLIRHQPEDRGTLIGVPRPYLVPSVDRDRPLFQEMYYWDSYFMNLGVFDTPRAWLIPDTAENCAALIERFGFVPNGTRYYFTSRSQPPFFTRMMWLADTVKRRRKDADADDFLRRMTAAAVTEHETCWLGDKHPHERKKLRGLSRYHDINYSHFLASCESGWDHSTRCDGTRSGTEAGRWLDFVPVCLNSILLARELDIARAYSSFGETDRSREWTTYASDRVEAMQELFWDADREFFFDYDWKAGARSNDPSLAGFYPLWAGWATPEQAARVVARWLPQFLLLGGVVTSLEGFAGRQWAYPNGWAPLQWLTAAGLDRYGFSSEANELRRRWCDTCESGFARRGTLSEKYNVADPTAPAECGLYGMVEGFGWTNAVYVDFARRLGLAEGDPVPV